MFFLVVSGLSWGWLFVLFFTFTMLCYCIGGCVYQHKKLGVTGLDMVPNVDFWNSLPFLVKDGVVFAMEKTKECVAYIMAPGGDHKYNSVPGDF